MTRVEREERCIQDFGEETCGEKTTGKTCVDGRIILKRVFNE